MTLIVQKFGGSSLATPDHILRVARWIVEEKKRGNRIVVVVSALGESTDHLLGLARQVSNNPPKRELDMLLSVGERISIALLAMAIHNLGFEAISFTGSQIGIITDTKHTEARILEVRATRLLEELQNGKVVIVAGFQGVSVNREITTLGRGGSDTTAIALAAALKADRCEIMKDVDGVYVAEPKLVPDVILNKSLGYDEMIEMANMGAGVLKTESIEIAKVHQIKIAVGSSFNGKLGTIITDRSLESSGISGIVGQKGLLYLTVNTSEKKIIHLINKKMVEKRLIAQSYYFNGETLELVLPDHFADAFYEIQSEASEKECPFQLVSRKNMGMIAIVGTGLNFNSEPAIRIFEAIEKLNIAPALLQVSQLRISWLSPESLVDNTIRKLYTELMPLFSSEDTFRTDTG